MTRKSGLGKGLSALIPTELDTEAPADGERGGGVRVVPITSVVPNPQQPRRHFDEESLAGLAASIAELGVLQPILVHAREDGTYELVAGERRLRASKRAGLTTIPVVLRPDTGDARTLLEEALVENLHRDDLNALEEGGAYQQLIEDFGLTQDEVARRVGKSRAAISNTLRLFLLPPTIQAMIVDGSLTAGHGRALLATPDRAQQQAFAEQAVLEGWSVRQTEQAVRELVAPDDGDRDPAAPPSSTASNGSSLSEPQLREPGLLELEQLLSEHLETRVQVTMGKGTGKVIVQFADLVDLERIYRKMAM